MTLTTKEIIPNKEWIVTDNLQKIGSISKIKKGYEFWHKGQHIAVKNLDDLKNNFGINISVTAKLEFPSLDQTNIYGYPCSSKPFHPVYNVKKKLPIFIKSLKSKSHFCAGYYAVKFKKGWVKSFCPKLITLERYPYEGPFKTEEDLKSHIKILNKNYEST